MEVWQLVLYAAASFLALKSLASLMSGHRQTVYRQLMLEEYARSQQRQAEEKRAARAKRMVKPVKRPGTAA